MSGIKPKLGICIDCGPDSKPQPLTAKRCQTHYWRHRGTVNGVKKSNKDKAATLAANSVFFASQFLQIPAYCENGCGTRLTKNGIGGYKTHIAHILPKGKFESVGTHPDNRVFLCGDCHTDMDTKGSSFMEKMHCFPLIIERFNRFVNLVTETNKMPACLEKIKS